METIISLTTLYFIFQVGLLTWFRLMDKNIFKLKDYKISLIPGFGIIYVIYLVIKNAFTQ